MKTKNHRKTQALPTQQKDQYTDTVNTIIISAYLLIDLTNLTSAADVLGLHWLLFSIVNTLAALYIATNKELLQSINPKHIFKNMLFILFAVFFLISGLSIVVTINKAEALISFSRLSTAFFTFIIVLVLLYKRLYIIKNIAFVVVVISFINAFNALKTFYASIGKGDFYNVILSVKNNTGNKNILSAALAIKVPVIAYYFYVTNGFKKYFSAVSLLLSLIVIFTLYARAAYLTAFLSVASLIIGFGIIYYQQKTKSLYLKNSIIILLCLGIGFAIGQYHFNKATNATPVAATNKVKSLSTIRDQSSQTRLTYWKELLVKIKQSPLIGVGYGNLKLHSLDYSNKILDNGTFSKHPHNDFLEIAAESGLPNALIFLSIFIVSFVLAVKTLFNKSQLPEDRAIALVMATALLGYFIDAFFNFPMERPNVLFLFVFALAFLVNIVLQHKQNALATQDVNSPSNINVKSTKYIIIPILLISTIIVASNWVILRSLMAQYEIDHDIETKAYKYKYEEINKMLPSFPNIGENSQPIGVKKAMYLTNEKRFDEAIKLLDETHRDSPFTYYDIYQKAVIYFQQKQMDSAYNNIKKAYYAVPRHFYYYKMACYIASDKKDTTEINKLYKTFNKYRKEPDSYAYYVYSLHYADYNPKKVKQLLDAGLNKTPKDSLLNQIKPYVYHKANLMALK